MEKNIFDAMRDYCDGQNLEDSSRQHYLSATNRIIWALLANTSPEDMLSALEKAGYSINSRDNKTVARKLHQFAKEN